MGKTAVQSMGCGGAPGGDEGKGFDNNKGHSNDVIRVLKIVKKNKRKREDEKDVNSDEMTTHQDKDNEKPNPKRVQYLLDQIAEITKTLEATEKETEALEKEQQQEPAPSSPSAAP